MLFTFEPKTYQDVKKNLSWWALIVFGCAAALIYSAVLPSQHREALEGMVSGFPPVVVGSVSVGAVALTFAIVVIGILGLHDRFYDSSVIRWRESYDVDFLLPSLLRPLGSRVHPRFWESAVVHRGKIMRMVFYPLVQDRDGVIGENRRVRFYEAATKYWMTQILEMAIVVSLFIAALYAFYLSIEGMNLTGVLWVIIGLQFGFVLNRWFRRKALVGMRAATLEEIEEIHADHLDLLDSNVSSAHAYLELPYRTHSP